MTTVKLMAMESDPRYVPSYGYCKAFLVSAGVTAKYEGNEALFMLCEEQPVQEVTPDMLSDIQTRTWKSGACNYVEREGNLQVPDGMVVVQREYIDICTRDSAERYAWICN